MTITPTHLLYGLPPRELADIRPEAQQCSPLMPGSMRLADVPPASAFSGVMLAPPGTIERRYGLARILVALAVGAPLCVLAPKLKGGNRIASELEAFGCTVISESRSHYRIATTTRPAVLHGIDDALMAGGLQQHSAHGLWTQPGVFSWDRMDEGSRLLLNHLPQFSGRGADLGAGIGVLSRAVLQSASVSDLTLIEIDRRAVLAAQKNIADARATYLWADIRTDSIAAINLDFIIMNPPFHDGGVEDKSLGLAFITRAAAMLKTGGQCWLVANRHLPYEQHLNGLFRSIRLVADTGGFKIIQAEK